MATTMCTLLFFFFFFSSSSSSSSSSSFFCRGLKTIVFASFFLVVYGNEEINVQLPVEYPNKYSKPIPASFPGYPTRYRGYQANWGAASRYPQQQQIGGYPASSNEYSGTDNRYPQSENGYPGSKNMYPGRNNAFVNNDLISDDSPTSTGYPQNGIGAGYGYPQSGGMGYPNYGYPVMPASPNDVINGKLVSPWDAALWDHPLDPDICRNLAGLTRSQIHICTRNTDLAGAAAIGLALAVRECKRQFAHHRWNCTALKTTSNNPHTAPIMARGYSESAFGHAITAAGVTHSVSRACAAGRLQSCTCGMVGGKRAWKWSGCHDNTKFGARYSRKFLDVRERAKDVISFTHLYNNEVGRKVVRRNREVRCKCHGMSGSCEIRTCWKAAPDFRFVGDTLKEKYMNAKVAAVEVFGNSANTAKKFRPVRKEISLDSPLLYVDRSPTYCSMDDRLDVPGTLGRHCNVSSTGPDSCNSLCCGRGYDQRRQKVTRKCHCRFKWCCHVTCRDCSEDMWIAVCK